MRFPPHITRVGAAATLLSALLVGGTVSVTTADAAATSVGSICHSNLPSQAYDTLALIAKGGPYPYPLVGHDTMQAVVAPADDGLQVMLTAAIRGPSPAEVAAMSTGRIRLTVTTAPPLVWLALAGTRISFDAPYAAGLAGPAHAADIVAASRRAHDWPAEARRLLAVVTVDSATGLIVAQRDCTLSRAWWRALAHAIEATPAEISRRDYLAAVARDTGRWTTADIMAHATAAEVAGL